MSTPPPPGPPPPPPGPPPPGPPPPPPPPPGPPPPGPPPGPPPPPFGLWMATVSSWVRGLPKFEADFICPDIEAVTHGRHYTASTLLRDIERWPRPNQNIQNHTAFLVVIHDDLYDMSAFELLQHIKERWPHIHVAIWQLIHDESLSIKCMQAGAIQYMNEPIKLEKVIVLRDRVIQFERS